MLADGAENVLRKCLKPTSLLFGRCAFGHQSPLSWIPGINVELIQPLQQIHGNAFFVREVTRSTAVEGDQVMDVGHLLLVFLQYGLESFLDALLRPERSEEVLLGCAWNATTCVSRGLYMISTTLSKSSFAAVSHFLVAVLIDHLSFLQNLPGKHAVPLAKSPMHQLRMHNEIQRPFPLYLAKGFRHATVERSLFFRILWTTGLVQNDEYIQVAVWTGLSPDAAPEEDDLSDASPL